VVVSQSFAKRFWPDQEPIGRTIRVFRDDAAWATVVGIAHDTRFNDFEHDPTPMMYFPIAQAERETYGLTQAMTIVIRTSADPAVVTENLRRVVRELDKDVPVSDLSTMEKIVEGAIATRRFSTTVLASFAAIALLLAAIGIYGVISYGVSQRTYELGIRMALGADRGSVLTLILGEGLRMAGLGVVIGVAASLFGAGLLRELLVGVTPRDLTTLSVVALVLLAVAITAAAIPARRATAVSPTEALRGG
jgi:putative ABC transport system permease protein